MFGALATDNLVCASNENLLKQYIAGISELSRQSNAAYLLRRLPVGAGVVLEQRRQRGPRRRPHVRRRHGEGRGQREDEERQRRHDPASCRHGQQLALVLCCCLNLDGSTARNRKWKEDMRTAGPGRGVVSRAGIYKHTQRPARWIRIVLTPSGERKIVVLPHSPSCTKD